MMCMLQIISCKLINICVERNIFYKFDIVSVYNLTAEAPFIVKRTHYYALNFSEVPLTTPVTAVTCTKPLVRLS